MRIVLVSDAGSGTCARSGRFLWATGRLGRAGLGCIEPGWAGLAWARAAYLDASDRELRLLSLVTSRHPRNDGEGDVVGVLARVGIDR